MLHEKYRKRLHTTNAIERLIQEIFRRIRETRVYPNRESMVRLIGALLIEFDGKVFKSCAYCF